MIIDEQELKISRVEVVQRQFNASNQIVKEEWHYYYPVDTSGHVDGFVVDSKKPKAKNIKK